MCPEAPTEPELPAMHVGNKHEQFVSAAPHDREEVRMRERERAKDEHVANRTRLDLEVEWWDSVVTTFHPGFFFLSKRNKDAG